MNYAKLHRYILIALCSVVAIVGLAAIYQFGILLQVAIVAVLVLLLWIALILYSLNSNIVILATVVKESTDEITRELQYARQAIESQLKDSVKEIISELGED